MLDKCCDVTTQLDLQFNVSKSHCIVFGELHRTRIIRHVTLRGKLVQWCDTIKYLGARASAEFWLGGQCPLAA